MNADQTTEKSRIAIVISFQRLPLKLLSSYGSELGQTPHLDRLACRGVVFDQHYCDDLSESRSRHGWWDGAASSSPQDRSTSPSLQELCGNHQVKCRLISDCQPAEWEIAPTGWDATYLETSSHDPNEQEELSVSTRLSRLWNVAREALSEMRSQNQSGLLWVHSTEMLSPPIPSLEFLELYLNEFPQQASLEIEENETLPEISDQSPETDDGNQDPTSETVVPQISEGDRVATYELIEETLSLISDEGSELQTIHIKTLNILAAAQLSEWDHALGQLLDILDEDLNDDHTLLILTADHGLPLQEASITKQLEQDQLQGPLQEESMHLPLLIAYGHPAVGERINALTQPADIPATLMDWFRVDHEFPEGRSLFRLIEGESSQLHDHLICRAGEWESIREPNWLFIRNHVEDIEKLYIKPEDRWQVLNVLSQYRGEAERLAELLNQKLR